MRRGIRLTKEEFCEYIRFMKERDEEQDKVNKLFTEAFTDSVFFPYSKYETEFLCLLEQVMQDEDNQWIAYYIYETDYGTNNCADQVTDVDGSRIPFKTPEDLYDLLVMEASEDEKERY